MQGCCTCIANAPELLQSCAKPSVHKIDYTNAVRSRYSAAQYNTALHAAQYWQKCRAYMHTRQSLNVQKTPHVSPSQARSGLPFVSILKKIAVSSRYRTVTRRQYPSCTWDAGKCSGWRCLRVCRDIFMSGTLLLASLEVIALFGATGRRVLRSFLVAPSLLKRPVGGALCCSSFKPCRSCQACQASHAFLLAVSGARGSSLRRRRASIMAPLLRVMKTRSS